MLTLARHLRPTLKPSMTALCYMLCYVSFFYDHWFSSLACAKSELILKPWYSVYFCTSLGFLGRKSTH